MGVFGQMKNNKRTPKQKKTQKWRRAQRAVARKKEEAPELDLEQVQLFSKDMLKNKMKNMKNNVNISNKKRNKLIKRLRHAQRDKDLVNADTDVQMADDTTKDSKKSKKRAKKKSTQAAVSSMDVEEVNPTS